MKRERTEGLGNTRLLLVDDSPYILAELTRLLGQAQGFEVVGTASHGVAALELADALKPDLVTLDVRMPVMNGIATLKHLMTRRPTVTVMLSALTRSESYLTYDCLRYGAVDFLTKPSGERGSLRRQKREILWRLRCASTVDVRCLKFCRLQQHRLPRAPVVQRVPRHLVLVNGGRTGLAVILTFLNALPRRLDTAVIVSVDLEEQAVGSFAMYLSRFTPFSVNLLCEGNRLQAGDVYLMSASSPQIVIDSDKVPQLRPLSTLRGSHSKEGVESLFSSAANVFKHRTLGLLVSGASRGAMVALESVLEKGGTTLAQSPDSAIEPEILADAGTCGFAQFADAPCNLAARVVQHLHRTDGERIQ